MRLSYISSEVSRPPMNDDTRSFLQSVLYRENEGLDDIVGIDLDKYWATFRANVADDPRA